MTWNSTFCHVSRVTLQYVHSCTGSWPSEEEGGRSRYGGSTSLTNRVDLGDDHCSPWAWQISLHQFTCTSGMWCNGVALSIFPAKTVRTHVSAEKKTRKRGWPISVRDRPPFSPNTRLPNTTCTIRLSMSRKSYTNNYYGMCTCLGFVFTFHASPPPQQKILHDRKHLHRFDDLPRTSVRPWLVHDSMRHIDLPVS